MQGDHSPGKPGKVMENGKSQLAGFKGPYF